MVKQTVHKRALGSFDLSKLYLCSVCPMPLSMVRIHERAMTLVR